MRFLRLIFVAALAVFLITLALANRQIVTLTAFPAELDKYLGGEWSVQMPLFLVIFLAMAFGVLMGFVWEYLRETHIRRQSRQRAHQVARLEREVGHLRDNHAGPRDDVLALVDGPQAAKSRPAVTPAAGGSGNALPAPR